MNKQSFYLKFIRISLFVLSTWCGCNTYELPQDEAGSTRACTYASECPIGFSCIDSLCQPTEACVGVGCVCAVDRDCVDTLVCIDQTCEEPSCTNTTFVFLFGCE